MAGTKLPDPVTIGTPNHPAWHTQIHEKLNELPCLKHDYGAGLGNGDDETRIQSALSDSNGGEVIACPADYLLGAYIDLSVYGQKLRATQGCVQHPANVAWAAPVRFMPRGAYNGDLIKLSAYGCELHDIITYSPTLGQVRSGFWYQNANSSKLYNCSAWRCKVGHRIDSLSAPSGNNVTMSFWGCSAYSCTQWGFAHHPGVVNTTTNDQAIDYWGCKAFQNGGSPAATANGVPDTGGFLLKGGGSRLWGGNAEGNVGCGVQIGHSEDRNGGWNIFHAIHQMHIENNIWSAPGPGSNVSVTGTWSEAQQFYLAIGADSIYDADVTFGHRWEYVLHDLSQASYGDNKTTFRKYDGTKYTYSMGQGGFVMANALLDASLAGIRTKHMGGVTPTGGVSGEVRVGSGKVWVNDNGTWKSVGIA